MDFGHPEVQSATLNQVISKTGDLVPKILGMSTSQVLESAERPTGCGTGDRGRRHVRTTCCRLLTLPFGIKMIATTLPQSLGVIEIADSFQSGSA